MEPLFLLVNTLNCPGCAARAMLGETGIIPPPVALRAFNVPHALWVRGGMGGVDMMRGAGSAFLAGVALRASVVPHALWVRGGEWAELGVKLGW